MELNKRVAVITASATGIGRACALALSRAGAHLVIADIDGAGAERTADDVRTLGGEARAVRCDVTDDGDVAALAAAAIERFGHVDLLHNHAGIAIGGDPPQIPLSEWERVLRVNLISQVRGVMTFLPHLEAGGGGHVVNTASGLGVHADDPVSAMVMPYAVSKKAIVGFTQYLAMWLPQRGVGVSLLAPDLTDTNLGRTATLYGVSAAEVVDGVERAAAVIQSPEEVGEALVEGLRRDAFLISMAPAVAARLRREADVLLDPTALLTDGE